MSPSPPVPRLSDISYPRFLSVLDPDICQTRMYYERLFPGDQRERTRINPYCLRRNRTKVVIQMTWMKNTDVFLDLIVITYLKRLKTEIGVHCGHIRFFPVPNGLIGGLLIAFSRITDLRD